ncbi:MAG TPA: hypothetical protein DDZ66_04755 [Firmicutes bacterium]|jgi:uncharacterized protein YqgV (UPF0045/DUF77 family)|nr:hypothetical protein [Bacillota bacterium]
MIKVQVSLYPVGQEKIANLQGLSTQFLDEHALDYDLQLGNTSLNTTIAGESDEVWTALRHLFQKNLSEGHDVVMVTTMTYWETVSE